MKMQVFGFHVISNYLGVTAEIRCLILEFDSPGLRFFHDAGRVIKIQAPRNAGEFNNSPKISIAGI